MDGSIEDHPATFSGRSIGGMNQHFGPVTPTLATWRLPDIFDEGREPDAAQMLAEYFRRRQNGRVCFSGARFERLGGGGDRKADANRFTADDFLAVSMLGVDVPAHGALVLMGDSNPDVAKKISELLGKLPCDLHLADADLTIPSGQDGEHYTVMDELWKLVMNFEGTELCGQNPGVGATKTSKLLARKRPHLFPVLDSMVKKAVTPAKKPTYNGAFFWRTLHHELTKDERRLESGLREIRRLAGELLKEDLSDISDIRVFDIISWMTAKTYTWEPEDTECPRTKDQREAAHGAVGKLPAARPGPYPRIPVPIVALRSP